MQEFNQLNLSSLVDMLAHYTARYMTILSDGGTVEEYNACKLIMEFLQKEIEDRKNREMPAKEANQE